MATSSPDPFGGSTVSEYTVTYTFNKALDESATPALADASFKSYDVDGTGTPFVTGQCEVDQDAPTKVVCIVEDADALHTNFDAVKNAVLFAVIQEAVESADPDGTYVNYPTSKVPTNS